MGTTTGLPRASIDGASAKHGFFAGGHRLSKVIPCSWEGVVMRKTSLLFAGAGVVLLAACSGDKKSAMNDDFKEALELASSTDGITLANSAGNMDMQVVSA